MALPTDPSRILRAIERGSLITVSRLTAQYSIQQLNDFLVDTDALLLASRLDNLDVFNFLLEESQSSTALAEASLFNGSTSGYAAGNLKVWREPSTHNSILHIAAAEGHVPVLTAYLQRFPDALELCNRIGQTALHLACQQGHLPCVALLLSAGALPDLTDDRGNTALHYSAQWNRKQVVDFLLTQGGANYLARNEAGWLPIDVAYDFSLHRSIQDKMRDLAEAHKKVKAQRRLEKQKEKESTAAQQQQQQQQRQIRRVESEHSLQSGTSSSFQTQQDAHQLQPSLHSTSRMLPGASSVNVQIPPAMYDIPPGPPSGQSNRSISNPFNPQNGYDGASLYLLLLPSAGSQLIWE